MARITKAQRDFIMKKVTTKYVNEIYAKTAKDDEVSAKIVADARVSLPEIFEWIKEGRLVLKYEAEDLLCSLNSGVDLNKYSNYGDLYKARRDKMIREANIDFIKPNMNPSYTHLGNIGFHVKTKSALKLVKVRNKHLEELETQLMLSSSEECREILNKYLGS